MKALQDAKQEAAKGIFISHESIDDWLDLWGTNNELLTPRPMLF